MIREREPARLEREPSAMARETEAIVRSFTDKQVVEKMRELGKLLLEARDALPSITKTAALRDGVDLTLVARIEKALEPWRDSAELRELRADLMRERRS